MKEPDGNNKHSRHSIRLAGYDYSQPGFYFVTICTKNRDWFFANVVSGEEKHFRALLPDSVEGSPTSKV